MTVVALDALDGVEPDDGHTGQSSARRDDAALLVLPGAPECAAAIGVDDLAVEVPGVPLGVALVEEPTRELNGVARRVRVLPVRVVRKGDQFGKAVRLIAKHLHEVE